MRLGGSRGSLSTLSEDPTARLSAALEGQYSIERKLGEGGMATVYLAEDVKHQRNVALKVLKPELAAVIGGERFVTEIRTTANLQHPHDLALFDSGEADGGGLRSVQETGGEAPQLRGGMNGRHPQLLPDGQGVLTVVDGAVHVYDPALDSSWAVVPEGLNPTYVKTGHILYVPPSGGLFAVPFDLASREVTGSPSRLLDRVASTDMRRGYSVSRDGTLVYLEGDVDVLGGVSGGPPPTRFLIRDFAGQVDTIRPPVGRYLIVLNWFEELKERVGN